MVLHMIASSANNASSGTPPHGEDTQLKHIRGANKRGGIRDPILELMKAEDQVNE